MGAIATGAHICLVGLQNDAYNTQKGVCLGVNDDGRYLIRLDSQKQILVKGANIQVIPRSNFSALNGFSADNAKVKETLACPPSNSSWANGLDKLAAAEWFVDCYRMRVDDEYAWAGDLRANSLYDCDHTEKTVATDFLVFCHLALFTGAVPHDNWDWVVCLDTYGHLLKNAFEKSDAGDKYGNENVFSAITGGRSLRFTAEIIYGSSAIGNDYTSPGVGTTDTVAEYERLGARVANGINWSNKNKLFKVVGGFAVWNRLLGSGHYSENKSTKMVNRRKEESDESAEDEPVTMAGIGIKIRSSLSSLENRFKQEKSKDKVKSYEDICNLMISRMKSIADDEDITSKLQIIVKEMQELLDDAESFGFTNLSKMRELSTEKKEKFRDALLIQSMLTGKLSEKTVGNAPYGGSGSSKDITCYKCSKKGHYASSCRSGDGIANRTRSFKVSNDNIVGPVDHQLNNFNKQLLFT